MNNFKKTILLLMVLTLIITGFSSMTALADIPSGGFDNAVTNSDTKPLENKIIKYIQYKKSMGSNNIKTFCVGRDELIYNESFMDFEKDYYGLILQDKFKTLSEQKKQINPKNLKLTYTHNPNVYDNPVKVSGLSRRTIDVDVQFNTETSRWEIQSDTGLLFKMPTDDKRGKWEVKLSGYDSTGKPLFDKESIGQAIFYIHTPPVPKMEIIDEGSYVKLRDKGSFDLDYQYSKNSKKDLENDREYNGIKEFYWSAKVNGVWVELGNGTISDKVSKSSEISDYKLTVEDYDGAKTSISKTSLILEKPIPNFEFKAGNTITNYFYKGNVDNETVKVEDLISWSDNSYDPSIYDTSGKRTVQWESIPKRLKATETDIFNDTVLNIFNNIVSSQKIPVALTAKNKYDISNTQTKQADVITLTTLDDKEGIESSCTICKNYATANLTKAYTIGDTVKIKYQYINNIRDNTDLKTKINYISSSADLYSKDDSLYSDIYIDENNTKYWNKIDYVINTYSNRTNELLHERKNSIVVHTPVKIDGYINDTKVGEVTSTEPFDITAETNKYSEVVTIKASQDLIVNGKTYSRNTPINLSSLGNNTWGATAKFVSNLPDGAKLTIQYETIAFNKRDKAVDSLTGTIYNYKLENFRITKVRDIKLADFYKENGKFKDVEMNVNFMCIDPQSFLPYNIDYLTKGYAFEFKIDSINFNDDDDYILITPSFYDIDGSTKATTAKQGFWKTSTGATLPLGTGGHSEYATIIMTREKVVDSIRSTWKGKYLIPGTAFLKDNNGNKIPNDIIVNFDIEGYKNGIAKYNYNNKQWHKELTTTIKYPYAIGDVIRYSGNSSNLDDIDTIRNRS